MSLDNQICLKDNYHFYSTSIFLIVCWLGVSNTVFAEESHEKDFTYQVNQRLGLDEHLSLDLFSLQPPIPLKSAVEEYNAARAKKEVKPLQIDLKKALAPSENPDSAKGFSPSLNTKSANQVSITDVRAKALKNNLTIQVAQLDPLIAAAEVREEEAKFDNIIFAYAKYGQLDS